MCNFEHRREFDWSILSWHTGAGSTKARSKYMADFINNSRIVHSVHDYSVYYKDGQYINPDIFKYSFRYPVVISVLGVGTSGKNSFTAMVKDLSNMAPGIHGVTDISIVDPLFTISSTLLNSTHSLAKDVFRGDMKFVSQYFPLASDLMKAKDDEWRQFVHDLKESWENYHSGATLNMMLKILQICNTSTALRRSNTKCDTNESIIFVQNRDKDSIDELAKACDVCGLIHMTLKIATDRVSTADFENDCDRNVDQTEPDIVVTNNGSLDALREKAHTFATLFHIANYIYGIPLNPSNPDPIPEELSWLSGWQFSEVQ